MKLTCDLCGGALQMNAGAKDASCKNCGLCYSLEMLRERLQKPTQAPQPQVKPAAPEVPQPQAEPKPAVSETIVTPVEPVQQKVVPAVEQFIMSVESMADDCMVGHVQSGIIGIGEQVYLDGDYSTAYRVYRFDNDINTTRVSAGETARIYLVPNRKARAKKPRMITGDQNPAMNAYRFNGSVEAYFETILQKNFAEYTLCKQVQWQGLNMPVTFMLLSNGHPVAAIFVFDSNDGKNRAQAQKAVSIFGGTVIGCTHFYKDYRNDESYVVDRIRAAMGEKPL